MTFAAELQQAERALKSFREALEEASGALEGGGGATRGGGLAGGLKGGKGGRGFGGAAAAIGLEALGEIAELGTPALQAFQATGSLEAAQGAGLLALGKQIQEGFGLPGPAKAIGGLVAEATGISDTLDVLGRTQDRVSGVTETLARAGVEIPDSFRQGLIDRSIEAEKRVQDERERVEGELAKFGNIKSAAGDSGVGSLLGVLIEIRDRIDSFGAGGAR